MKVARPVRWEGWRKPVGVIRPLAALSLPNVTVLAAKATVMGSPLVKKDSSVSSSRVMVRAVPSEEREKEALAKERGGPVGAFHAR